MNEDGWILMNSPVRAIVGANNTFSTKGLFFSANSPLVFAWNVPVRDKMPRSCIMYVLWLQGHLGSSGLRLILYEL